MRNLFILAISFLAIPVISGCKKEYATPTLKTSNVSAITSVSARSGGEIIDNGGAPVLVRGICWSTSEKPTINDQKTSDGSGSGKFISIMEGLTTGITYYVRAYATNSAGTDYGNQVTFSTIASIPSVTTAEITEITVSTATSGGNVTAEGGANVTARGVCWSTSPDPTIAGSHTTDGIGKGNFTSNVTGLNGNTTYYLRAYATNSIGTAYGNQVTFTTSEIIVPTLTTAEITGLTSTSAVSGGNISSNGGSEITANGVCWSTSESPTLEDNFTTGDPGSAVFVSNITGLTNGTIYYVRAYATNSAGTAYGNQVTFITPVTDIEGNVYKTVLIGTQIWMAENLKTTRYSDNTIIPIVTDNATWVSLTTPAYSWFNNNIANKDVFGALYNWHTVNTGKLCPDGWHVPTNEEFNTLELHLGIPVSEIHTYGYRGTDQGTQMKSTTTWDVGGNGTNSSGFNALGAGYRQWNTGVFTGLGTYTYFWSSTDDAVNGNPNSSWYRRLDYIDPRIFKATTIKAGGKYIRCLKN
jgi:uncharacterized protein (TIGR02145 family)